MKIRFTILLFLLAAGISHAQQNNTMQKDKDTCSCRIGDAHDAAALLAQLNNWDKTELENYYTHTYLCANCIVDYISSGETAGFVEAHLKCLQCHGVSAIWDNDKKVFTDGSNIFTEQSDAKIHNLKGNIKTSTVFIFDTATAPQTVTANSHWQQKIIAHYNRDGNTDSIQYFDKNAEVPVNTIIYTYTGNERLSKESGKTFYTSRKEWLATNTFVETIYDSAAAVESITTVVIEMQDKCKIITEKKWVKIPKEPFSMNVENRSFFDEQGRLTARKTKTDNSPETEETNKDLLFDTMGNATKSIKSNGKTILRQYQYY